VEAELSISAETETAAQKAKAKLRTQKKEHIPMTGFLDIMGE
jgi:hypothetical protein